MMRSLFAAVSGLKTHQQRMDVIGNNIANVNTVGFKRSRVTFQDMLSQTIRGASRPVAGGRGGTNPIQIGPGVLLGSIDLIMDGSSLQDTGKATDLGIEGDGFFILSDGGRTYYTRVGTFDFGEDGSLVSLLNGMRVQGWMPDNPDTLTDIRININESESAKATTKMVIGGNLDSRVPIYDDTNPDQTPKSRVLLRHTVYDSKGQEYTVTIKLTKNEENQWTWELVTVEDSAGQDIGAGTQTGEITFNTDGTFNTVTNNTISFSPNGSEPVNITLDFSKLTQYGSDQDAAVESQDGYKSGVLESFTIDQNGNIVGVFSNGITRNLGQIALARFANPAGLLKEGNSLYSITSNSGSPLVGAANSGGFGSIKPGSLEMSNVDLSTEFTDMIITQRGFQANSRVITASDEMLQELVNLKR